MTWYQQVWHKQLYSDWRDTNTSTTSIYIYINSYITHKLVTSSVITQARCHDFVSFDVQWRIASSYSQVFASCTIVQECRILENKYNNSHLQEWGMCVCVYVHACVCVYVCVCVCVHACVHACMCLHACLWTTELKYMYYLRGIQHTRTHAGTHTTLLLFTRTDTTVWRKCPG